MKGKKIAGDGVGFGRVVNVNVRFSNGPVFNVGMGLNSTVRDLRAVATVNCAIPAEQQVLIYEGRIMTDDRTLESFGIEDDAMVELARLSDAGILNASLMEHRQEEFVENLEYLGENPETLRVLYQKICKIRAACDRNITEMTRILGIENPYLLDGRIRTQSMIPYMRHPLPRNSRPAAAGGMDPQFPNQQIPFNPLYPRQMMHRPRPQINPPFYPRQMNMMHHPRPQFNPQHPHPMNMMHRPRPQINPPQLMHRPRGSPSRPQTMRQNSLQLPQRQTAQNSPDQARVDIQRGQTSGSGAAQNDGGPSTSGNTEQNSGSRRSQSRL